MARAAKAARVEHVCGRCGYRTARWLGRCPECGEWASIVEEVTGAATGADAVGIDRVPLEAGARLRTGIGELDRALGGGLVAGSAVLLAGDPGIGKSTLLLSALDRVARAAPDRPVLYVSGEESLAQIRLRGERLAALSPGLLLRADTSVLDSLQAADPPRPPVLAVDSVVALLTAVLEKKEGLLLSDQDIYVNVAGGASLDEPAGDLAVAAAVLSSFRDVPLDPRTLVLGEVGLAGEVRGVSQVEQRLAEAAQLGFRRCVLPESNARRLHDSPLELRPAATVGAAMEA